MVPIKHIAVYELRYVGFYVLCIRIKSCFFGDCLCCSQINAGLVYVCSG